MDYPKVPHSHVVPRGYLRVFADAHDRVTMHRPGRAGPGTPIGTKDAGVRTNFYRRTRPSGERIYDTEWSLREAENATLPVLRTVTARWPLDTDDKAKLGTLIALQMFRVPRWHAWHQALVSAEVERLRSAGVPGLDGIVGELIGERVLGRLDTDMEAQRMLRMLSATPKAAGVLASMHWTLLRFARPVLATSDDPVVLCAAGAGARSPHEAADGRPPLLHTEEVRMPLAPDLLLLMSWLDEPDGPIRRAPARVAGCANAFTVAQAADQWFHRPGASIPITSGRILPLGTSLLGVDLARAAAASRRRRAIEAAVTPELGTTAPPDMSVVTVQRVA